MGIDLSQWRVQIGLYYKYVGRTRAHRGGCKAGAASSSARCSPMLALTMVFCLITAPSLLLQAGDVERNPGPGPPKTEDGKEPGAGSGPMEVEKSSTTQVWGKPIGSDTALMTPIQESLKYETSSTFSPMKVPQPVSNSESFMMSTHAPALVEILCKKKLSRRLADELKSRKMIGETVYAAAIKTGSGITQQRKVSSLITAIQSKLHSNPKCYYEFIEVLQSEGIREHAQEALTLLSTGLQAASNWEYVAMSSNSFALAKALTANCLAFPLAEELKMTKHLKTGRGTTEERRSMSLITAVMDEIKSCSKRYYEFIEILKSERFCIDAEAALALLPTEPQIVEQPQDLNTNLGQDARVYVRLAIGAYLKYQWLLQSGEPLPENERFCGGESDTLQIKNVEQTDEGSYICKITNPTSNRSVFTSPVSLSVVILDTAVHSEAILSPEEIFQAHKELKINFREVAVYLYNRNLIAFEDFDSLCGTKLTPEQKWHKLLLFLHTNPGEMEDFLDSLEDSERKNLTEQIKDDTKQTSADQKEFEEYISTRPLSPNDEPGELGDERLSELPYQHFLSEFQTLFTDGFAVKDNIADAVLHAKSLAQDDTIVGVALGYDLDTRWKEQRPCVRVLMKASTRGLDVSTAESQDKMEDLKKKVSEEVTKCMNKSEKRKYSAKDYESWLKFTDHDPKRYKCTELYSGDTIVPGITIVPSRKENTICEGGTMGLMVRVELEYTETENVPHISTYHFGLTCAHTVLNNIQNLSDSEWVHCKKWKEWKEIEKPFKDWRRTQPSSSPSIPTHTDTRAIPTETYLYRLAPALFPRKLSRELGQINWKRYQAGLAPLPKGQEIRCCCAVCGWFGGKSGGAILYPSDDQKAMIDIAALSVSDLKDRCWPAIEGIDKWELATNFTDIFPQSGVEEELSVCTYNIRGYIKEVGGVERQAILCNEHSLTSFDSGHKQRLYNLSFLDKNSEQRFAQHGDSGSIVYRKVCSDKTTVARVLGLIYGGAEQGRRVFGFPLCIGIKLLSFELYYAAAEMFLKDLDPTTVSIRGLLDEYIQGCKKHFYSTKTNQPIAMKAMPTFRPPKEFKFSISPCLGQCENKSPAEGLPLAEKSPKLQCAESLVTEPPLHQKPLLPVGSLEAAVHSEAIPTPEEILLVRYKLTINFRKVADYLHNKKLITQKQFDSLSGNKLTPEIKWRKIVFLLQNLEMEDFLDSLEDGDRRNLIEMIENATRQTKINSLVENMNDLHLEEPQLPQQSSLPVGAIFDSHGGSQMENNTQDSSMSSEGKITPSQYQPPESEDYSTSGSINNHHEQ